MRPVEQLCSNVYSSITCLSVVRTKRKRNTTVRFRGYIVNGTQPGHCRYPTPGQQLAEWLIRVSTEFDSLLRKRNLVVSLFFSQHFGC